MVNTARADNPCYFCDGGGPILGGENRDAARGKLVALVIADEAGPETDLAVLDNFHPCPAGGAPGNADQLSGLTGDLAVGLVRG